jgi:hypothetical protein
MTTTTPSSTTTAPPAQVRPALAVFPVPGSAPLQSPTAAARQFAATFLHFPQPVVTAAEQISADREIVTVRANPTAPDTHVALLRTDGWWVLGAESPDLLVLTPSGTGIVTSPLTVVGRSTASESVINLEVRAADGATSLGSGTALGGSMGTMMPFRTSLAFSPPPTTTGSLVVTTVSPKDGTVLEATVVALRFS